jgi:uncharacterized peroxidase-related enzyme
MPFFKSMADNAGPPAIFTLYPELYRPWSEMSQTLMNGPSPLSHGERELILAFTAGAVGCKFVFVAHAEVAHEWGFEEGVVDKLLEDLESAPVEPKLKPLLAFVRKLVTASGSMNQADADAVFAAGWDEKALHDAIAVTARMSFMQRLVEGFGFTPLSKEVAKEHALRRIKHGYVNMYRAFAKPSAG